MQFYRQFSQRCLDLLPDFNHKTFSMPMKQLCFIEPSPPKKWCLTIWTQIKSSTVNKAILLCSREIWTLLRLKIKRENVWMNGSIFIEWLNKPDKKIEAENKRDLFSLNWSFLCSDKHQGCAIFRKFHICYSDNGPRNNQLIQTPLPHSHC